MRRFAQFIIMAAILVVGPVDGAQAFTLKGKLKSSDKNLDLTEFTVVAEGSDRKISSAAVASNGSFKLSGVGASDRLFLLRNANLFGPIVVAVSKGKKVKSYQTASRKKFCSDGKAKAVMALKKKLKGKAGTLLVQLDLTNKFGYAKRTVKKKFLAKSALASVSTSDCMPTGVSGSTAGQVAIFADKVDPNDADNDGTENDKDMDDDNDGLSDTFDPDNDGDGVLDDSDADNNDKVDNRVWNFQQIHLDRENAYNTQVMQVTTAMIDSALAAHGGLALQVISGSQVELDCGGTSGGGGLSYCTTGGTGRAREPYPNGQALPDDMDADGDGKAEIQAGGTGDLQIAPGATSSEIQPGDAFIEEVTDAQGKVTKYAGMVNGVVHDVPGITTITTSLATHTFSYPGTTNAIGTSLNPILVPATGDVLVTVTTYVPHYHTGGATRVVPAGVKMIANIPNGPCTYDDNTKQCSGGGSGPGLIPGTLYSNPSSGWSVSTDGVQSSAISDVAEGSDTAVTYTMNLVGSGGVTGWDSGEHLMVPIQSLDNNGTTAAHNVWFKRQ